MTDDVHPEFAAQAVAAAQTIGLDIAGVDVVCDSVLRPLEAQGGGIVEINACLLYTSKRKPLMQVSRIRALRGPNPVSYTHLDVYKRQTKLTVDAAYVDQQLAVIARNTDLSKYVL